MNVLYYGNCQLFAIKILLNLQDVNEKHLECFNTNIEEIDFLNIIKEQDIIITQPIKEGYRSVSFLSTSFIINNCKKDCKIIIVDSCHFDFYYFDLTYKFWKGDILHVPDDYHYKSMIECFQNKESIDYYIENFVNNVDFFSLIITFLDSSDKMSFFVDEAIWTCSRDDFVSVGVDCVGDDDKSDGCADVGFAGKSADCVDSNVDGVGTDIDTDFADNVGKILVGDCPDKGSCTGSVDSICSIVCIIVVLVVDAIVVAVVTAVDFPSTAAVLIM
jgi:hypothetical protein